MSYTLWIISENPMRFSPIGLLSARQRWDSNPRIPDLQSGPLNQLGYVAIRRVEDSNLYILAECRLSKPVLYQLSQLCRFENFVLSLSRCSSNADASIAFSSLLAQKKRLPRHKVSGPLNMFFYLLWSYPYFFRIFAKSTLSRVCLTLYERMKSSPHSLCFSSDDSRVSL